MEGIGEARICRSFGDAVGHMSDADTRWPRVSTK